jgi:hypothetical protein
MAEKKGWGKMKEAANWGGLTPYPRSRLLSTLALEHAHRKAISGIEHGPKQRGLLAAMATRPNRIGFEAGKDFVFEFVIHEPITSRSGTNR